MTDKEIKELQKEAGLVKRQFDDCQQYKNTKGILSASKRSVNYYEGRQWEEFKGSLPFEKPTQNIIANIIDGKNASINQKTYTINYFINNDQVNTERLARFAKFQQKEMDLEGLSYQLGKEAMIKGTGILYNFWNEDRVSELGDVSGGVEPAIIDISNFCVSNPREKDIQKQEYIIIKSRESVRYVRESQTLFNEDEAKKLIGKKEFKSIYTNDTEQANEEMCDSYLKMFRINGEVYYQKSTEEIVYQKPTPINPLVIAKELKEQKDKEEKEKNGMYEADAVNNEQMTRGKKYSYETAMKLKFRAHQYPVDILVFMERNDCIFGISLVETLIPIQKLVNQLIAINTLAAYKHVMPTLVIKEGALGSKKLDLTPGKPIIDRSGYGVNNAIYPISLGSMPTEQFNMAQALIALTKDVTRSNDILNDGRDLARNMSGTAISQLLTVRDMPIAQWQQAMARFVAREGRILEMFYKLFYRNARFNYVMSDTEMDDAISRGENVQTPYQDDTFNGEDYLDTPFNITVEVGETSKYSDLLLQATLEQIFAQGVYSNLGPDLAEVYIQMLPDYAFPKKAEFKRLNDKVRQSQINQLAEQNAQLQQALSQAQMQNQALQDEFTNKINQANENTKKQIYELNNLRRMNDMNNTTNKQ